MGAIKTLVLIIVVVAVIVLIVGLTVKTLGFLLGVAPILFVAAAVLLILSRSRGHRIP